MMTHALSSTPATAKEGAAAGVDEEPRGRPHTQEVNAEPAAILVVVLQATRKPRRQQEGAGAGGGGIGVARRMEEEDEAVDAIAVATTTTTEAKAEEEQDRPKVMTDPLPCCV